MTILGTSCACGRTSFKLRCVGRTDDMLIVLGVNVFPSAIKDVVTRFYPGRPERYRSYWRSQGRG